MTVFVFQHSMTNELIAHIALVYADEMSIEAIQDVQLASVKLI